MFNKEKLKTKNKQTTKLNCSLHQTTAKTTCEAEKLIHIKKKLPGKFL